jgi:Protein phosphatase 2C
VWRHIAQSLQGPSHLDEGTPCQDAHGIRVLGDAPHEILTACVADGAGSAKYSEIGSAIACEAILEHATRFLEANDLDVLQFDQVLLWCDDIRTRIKQEADERGCQIREFATTLCAAIIAPGLSAFFQIGDGAIVLGNELLYGIVFWPQRGEYANSTNFLTSDEYREQLEFITTTSPCSKIVLMTDGLERLALRFDSKIPHVPFFDPLFRALQATHDLCGLNDGLRGFLSSDPIHHRTDDDKTLILATRCADGAA